MLDTIGGGGGAFFIELPYLLPALSWCSDGGRDTVAGCITVARQSNQGKSFVVSDGAHSSLAAHLMILTTPTTMYEL